MLLKTKLLVALGTLGVVGGVGTGVYFVKNKNQEKQMPLPESGEKGEQTGQSGETPPPEPSEKSQTGNLDGTSQSTDT